MKKKPKQKEKTGIKVKRKKERREKNECQVKLFSQHWDVSHKALMIKKEKRRKEEEKSLEKSKEKCDSHWQCQVFQTWTLFFLLLLLNNFFFLFSWVSVSFLSFLIILFKFKRKGYARHALEYLPDMKHYWYITSLLLFFSCFYNFSKISFFLFQKSEIFSLVVQVRKRQKNILLWTRKSFFFFFDFIVHSKMIGVEKRRRRRRSWTQLVYGMEEKKRWEVGEREKTIVGEEARAIITCKWCANQLPTGRNVYCSVPIQTSRTEHLRERTKTETQKQLRVRK